jgi:ATP-binding cassette, subfamily F, member 2
VDQALTQVVWWQIIDKMEAAGLVEKVETLRPLRFNFEDVRKLPPPIIAFDEVAFSYSGKPADYLYKKLSFGIECVFRDIWLLLLD